MIFATNGKVPESILERVTSIADYAPVSETEQAGEGRWPEKTDLDSRERSRIGRRPNGLRGGTTRAWPAEEGRKRHKFEHIPNRQLLLRMAAAGFVLPDWYNVYTTS